MAQNTILSQWNRGQNRPRTYAPGANFYPTEQPWKFEKENKQNQDEKFKSPQSSRFAYTGQVDAKPLMSTQKENQYKKTQENLINQGNLAFEDNLSQMKDFLFNLAKKHNKPTDAYTSKLNIEKPVISAHVPSLLATPGWRKRQEEFRDYYQDLENKEVSKHQDLTSQLHSRRDNFLKQNELAKQTTSGQWEKYRQNMGAEVIANDQRIESTKKKTSEYQAWLDSYANRKSSLKNELNSLQKLVQQKQEKQLLKLSDPDKYWYDKQYGGIPFSFDDPEWGEFEAFRTWRASPQGQEDLRKRSPQYFAQQEAARQVEIAEQQRQLEAQQYAYHVNKAAIEKLQGKGQSIQNSTSAVLDPYREEAINLRRKYPGLPLYDIEVRRSLGVPEKLLYHPFNQY